MNFEEPQNVERPGIQMTSKEFYWLRCSIRIEHRTDEFAEELERLGIQLDSGHIKIEVDGKKMFMTTSPDTFGDIVENPDDLN